MKLLITGGTGFIGSRLALRCLGQGDDVRVLGQENTAAEEENRDRIAEAGAEIVLGSVEDVDMVREAVHGCDAIVHLAAAQHEMDVPDRHFYDVNVEGTMVVLEAAAVSGVKRFVHGSTIGVYGWAEGVLDENAPCRPDNIYGVTKKEAEDRVLAARSRLPVVALRIPEVYGPGDRRLLKLFRAVHRGVFFMIGRGSNDHEPIYIDDLSDGILAAVRSPAAVGELFQLAGKERVTTREMVEAIASALGTSAPRLTLPLPLFAGVATALELGLRPLGIQPPLHRRRLDFFRKSFRLDDSKSRETLGLAPAVGFAEGARRTAEWYHEQELI